MVLSSDKTLPLFFDIIKHRRIENLHNQWTIFSDPVFKNIFNWLIHFRKKLFVIICQNSEDEKNSILCQWEFITFGLSVRLQGIKKFLHLKIFKLWVFPFLCLSDKEISHQIPILSPKISSFYIYWLWRNESFFEFSKYVYFLQNNLLHFDNIYLGKNTLVYKL